MTHTQPEAPIIAEVLRDAAARLGIPVDQLTVTRVEAQKWRDTCLGCAKSDDICHDTVTPGFVVVVAGRDQRLVYHTDERDKLRRCELRATYQRVSGWGGHDRQVVTVEAATLSTVEATELRELIDASDFYNLEDTYSDPHAPTEATQHGLSVEAIVHDQERSHTVAVYGDNASLPPGLRALLDWFARRLDDGSPGTTEDTKPMSPVPVEE